MQARCPHCSNVFNTDRAGVQFCPSCGQQINVPDPAGASAGGQIQAPGGFGGPPPPPPPGAPAGGERGPVPWEERSQRGLFGAFFENWKMVLVQPERFFARLNPGGSLTDGLFFAWICYAVSAVLSLPFSLLMQSYNRAQMDQVMQGMKDVPPQMRQFMEQYMNFIMGGGTIAAVLFQVIIFPVILIIIALFVHLFGLIFGVAKNGFNATARVVGYSFAPYSLGWIPLCGGLVAPIYFIVLLIMGQAKAHDTTVGRSVASILVPLLVLCCCCVGAFAVAIGSIASAAAGAQ